MRLGDAVRIERRYIVDGSLTSVLDEGRFKGVQLLGTSEHLVIESGPDGDVRMIPLHSISEIALVGGARSRDEPESFDPSFA